MSTTPTTPAAPTTQTWTFVGHWDEDRIVVEYVLPGQHEDERVDDGHWEQGLWCDSGTGATIQEARRNAIAPYEAEIHGDEDEDEDENPAYPNGRCSACGWGLGYGCPNPDCDRPGTKLHGDEDEDEDENEDENPAYPNGRCTACGWGLGYGCPNPDCDRPGTKLPADEDEPVTHRYVTTLTFEATDDRDAEGLITSLASAIEDSDALPVYGTTTLTTPRRDTTWPDNDTDRDDFADWQADVANGDTLRGFRDWQAELAADRDG